MAVIGVATGPKKANLEWRLMPWDYCLVGDFFPLSDNDHKRYRCNGFGRTCRCMLFCVCITDPIRMYTLHMWVCLLSVLKLIDDVYE